MMDLSNIQPRSRWTTLLWKDIQQIKTVVIAVSLSLFVIQVITALWGLLEDSSRRAFTLETIPIWTLCGPILVAIGCAGMLIGHERQSNTWSWQSSLPISWTESLSSKLVVTLLASLTTTICSAVVPIGLVIAGRVSFFGSPDDTDEFISLTLAGVIFFFQVVAVCFFTSLLIREPLNALATAGVFLTLGQWLLMFLVLGTLFRPGRQQEPTAFVLFVLWFFSVAFTGLLFAYRWRWSRGQFAELRFRKQPALPSPTSVHFQYRQTTSPGTWQALLWHSLQNSIGLRLIAVLGTLVFAASFSITGLSDLPILIGIFLCGLSAFEGDRSLGRFRFLADRGINPTQLVTSRLAIASAFAIVILVLCSLFVATPPAKMGNSLALALLSFSVPALMSMAFPKPIMAGGVAMIMWLGSAFFSSIATAGFRDQIAFEESTLARFCDNPIYWASIQSVILLAAIYPLARRWIVLDDLRVPLFATGLSMLVLFAPWLLLMIISAGP